VPFDHPSAQRLSVPDDWLPVPSSVPHVEAWAPPDRGDDTPLTQRFACPSCGATTAFDPTRGLLACGHCGHGARIEPTAPAEIGEFTAEAMAASAQGWGVERQALHCDACGAEVALDAGQLSSSCPFCASTHVDLRAVTDGALRPQQVLPFQLTAADAGQKAAEWLGNGWKHPSDLASLARVDRFAGIYLPWWLFDASMDITWRCQVGTVKRTTYTDGNGRRRTRTTTTWRWRDGTLQHAYHHVPVPGTTRLQGLERVGSFPSNLLQPYDPALLAGFGAQAYDLSLPDAWDLGRHTMRESAALACKRAAGGDKQRYLSLSANLDDEAWAYALMPVYVSAYTFRGRTWVVMVNGATGEVGGQRPVAWFKVYLAMAAMLTPGLFTAVCLGLPGLFFAGFGLILLGIGAVFLLLGGVAATATYTSAVREETL
jgi:transcription elongation factor Elf1